MSTAFVNVMTTILTKFFHIHMMACWFQRPSWTVWEGESKYTRAQRLRYFRNGMKHFFRLPENMETMGIVAHLPM